MESTADDLAFFLTRAAQQNLWDDHIHGAADAAAGAVLASAESLLSLGPAVLDAALAGRDAGVRVQRLAHAMAIEVRARRLDPDAASAARALCAYFQMSVGQAPSDLLELSLQETVAGLSTAHGIALLQDRERLLCRLRREFRTRPAEMKRLLEATFIKNES